MNKLSIEKFGLFFLVGVVIVYLLVIHYLNFPRWIATNYDPLYPYLFNSLDWYSGGELFLWGHPGVIVHWVNYFSLFLYDVFHEGGVNEWALQAESLIYFIGNVNILLFSVALMYALKRLSETVSLNERFLFLVGIVSTINLNEVIMATPEGYLAIFSPLFVAEILVLIKNQNQDRNTLIRLALLSAMLLSTKFTAIFIVTVPFLFLPKKNWLSFIFFFGISFLILMLPIIDYLITSVQWLLAIIANPGFGYGAESTSKIKEPIFYCTLFLKALMFDKVWLGFLIGSVGGLLVFYKIDFFRLNKLVLSGLLFLLFLSVFIMVYKEMFRYFVPNKYISIILLFYLKKHASPRIIFEFKGKIIISCLSIWFLLSFGYLIKSQVKQLKRFNDTKLFSLKMESLVKEGNNATLRMFTSSSPSFATFFGSLYSKGNYITSKNDYYLMFFSGLYYADFSKWALYDNNKQTILLEEVFEKSYDKVYLIGRKSAVKSPYWPDNKEYKFIEIEQFNGEYIYEITQTRTKNE